MRDADQVAGAWSGSMRASPYAADRVVEPRVRKERHVDASVAFANEGDWLLRGLKLGERFVEEGHVRSMVGLRRRQIRPRAARVWVTRGPTAAARAAVAHSAVGGTHRGGRVDLAKGGRVGPCPRVEDGRWHASLLEFSGGQRLGCEEKRTKLLKEPVGARCACARESAVRRSSHEDVCWLRAHQGHHCTRCSVAHASNSAPSRRCSGSTSARDHPAHAVHAMLMICEGMALCVLPCRGGAPCHGPRAARQHRDSPSSRCMGRYYRGPPAWPSHGRAGGPPLHRSSELPEGGATGLA